MHYAVGFSPKTLNAQVTGRGVLPPGERSNAWTVALTPGGVVDYLNRKTSPLGARPTSYLVSTWFPTSFPTSLPCAFGCILVGSR
jgi:hypothetical protein